MDWDKPKLIDLAAKHKQSGHGQPICTPGSAAANDCLDGAASPATCSVGTNAGLDCASGTAPTGVCNVGTGD